MHPDSTDFGELGHSRRRWFVLALLVASSVLNYFDRQLVSMLKPQIKAAFALTDSHYSLLLTVFMTAYVIMYPISGRLVDRYGSQRCLVAFLGTWSFAATLIGFASGLWYLLLCMFVLGLAQPGSFPASLRSASIWFIPAERGFATGMVSAGSAIGAIIAPPVIAWMAQRHGWRGVFVVPGELGAVWLFAWWGIYREPNIATAKSSATVASWAEILRNRAVLGIVLARLVSDPVWYFIMYWFPGYIQERMGLSLREAGAVGWVPFLVADIGGVAAAVWSDRLVRRGRRPAGARFSVLFGVACLAPLAMTLGLLTDHLVLTVAVFSVLAFVSTSTLFTGAALITDVVPQGYVGTVVGIAGAFGAVGGLLFNACVGPVVERVGYSPIFIVAGALHLIAVFILRHFLGLRKGGGPAMVFSANVP